MIKLPGEEFGDFVYSFPGATFEYPTPILALIALQREGTMTTITFEYPCGEYQDGWFNINGSTIATGTLIEIKGDTAIVQFDSARHETGLEPGQTVRIPVDQVMEQLAGATELIPTDQQFLKQITPEIVDKIVFGLFDVCQCPKCGPRLKSKGEVIAQKDGFICTSCNTLTQSEDMEIPF